MHRAPLDYGIGPPAGRLVTSRRLLVLGVVGACLAGAFVGLPRAMEPQTGRNVLRSAAPISGLPADASNVSYYRGGAFDPVPAAYEFDTSEESFIAWAKSNDWAWQMTAGTVRRYDMSEAEITRGLFHRWSREDAGRVVAYDLEAGRAYYFCHSR